MQLTPKDKECKFLKDNRCSIYNERPPACIIYPLTPYFDDILVDTTCKAVVKNNNLFNNNGELNNSFYHKRLENFNEKRLRSLEWVQMISKNVVYFDTQNSVELYKFNGLSEDKYINMHLSSLKNFS